MNRGMRIAALALAAAALFPAGAEAADVQIAGSRIDYVALAGETNNLVISRDGADYVFAEVSGVPVTPAAPCVSAGASAARCPVADIQRFDIFLENQGDTLAIAPSVSADPLEEVQAFGDAGIDTLSGGPNVENHMQGNDGNDVVTGGNLDDDLSAGAGVDTLTGGPGDDLLRVVEGTEGDTAIAGPGDDGFQLNSTGPDGADTLSGGPGDDRIDLRDRRDAVTVTQNGTADDGAGCPGPGCEGDNYGADIEDFSFGTGSDRFVGSGVPQFISGGPGNDDLNGGGGSDEISGDDGDDTLQGGGGNDSLGGDDGADVLRGGTSDDYLYLNDLSDGDRDVFDGGPGFDETGDGGETLFSLRIDLDGRADDGPRDGTFEGLRDNVLATVEGLEGTERADILIGSARPNELEGNGGADRLIGRGGADGIDGARGRDRIVGGKGRDSLSGGGGADQMNSRDQSADEVSCGSSGDTVKADRRDRTGADCDLVKRR